MASTPWHQQPWISFDTETTGVDPEHDRIVTASLLLIDPLAGDVATYEWLVDPGVDIPQAATAVHGVSTEHARTHGQPPAEALAELATLLAGNWTSQQPVIVYNAPYDLSLLGHELARHHIDPVVVGPVIDPLVLDRGLDRYRPGSRKLVDVAAHYGVPLDEASAHGSSADALAAARVTYKLAHRSTVLSDASLDELQQQQRSWYAEWAESFEQYLHRQGREDAAIPRGWPTRETAPADDPTGAVG